MTQNQNSKYEMYKAILLVLTNNSSIWSSNTAFSALVALLQGVVGNLLLSDGQQGADITGITNTKQAAKETLITLLLSHARGGFGYASNIGNLTLKGSCKLTKTKINRLLSADLASTAQTVHDLLLPLVANLTNWGVTTTTLNNLQLAITAYEGKIATPKNAIAARKVATKNLPDLITQGDDLLHDQLDAAMEQFASSNASFYEQYFNDRVLSHTGHRTKVSFTLHVHTAAGVVLPLTIIDLVSTGGKKRHKLSNELGICRMTRLSPDTFTITVKLTGYATQTKTEVVATPQLITLDFVMVPLIAPPTPVVGSSPVTQ